MMRSMIWMGTFFQHTSKQVFAVASRLILSLAALAVVTHAQAAFSPAMNVSNDAGNSQTPQIAVDAKGNINMAWLDNSPGNFSVFFSRSSDGGATFSHPLILSSPGGAASGEQVGADSNGNIYVAWFDSNSGTPSIFLRHSNDGGATFFPATSLPAAQGVLMSVDPAGKIYLVWAANDNSGVARLVFSRSLDEGTTFTNPVVISNPSATAVPGALALDGSGNINVAWVEAAAPQNLNNVYFSRSLDGGTSFSSPKTVTNSSGPLYGVAGLAVDSVDNIHVLWTTANGGQTNTYLSRSGDGGATFAVENFQSGVSDSQQSPQLALDSHGGLNIVWNSGGQNPVLNFARSADEGATFATQTIEGGNYANPGSASITTDPSGNINIVWTQGGGPTTPAGMMYAKSTDAGHTFSSPQQIASTSGQNVTAVVNASGNVYAAWSQLVATGNGDIFFEHSTAPAPPAASVSLASLNLSPSSVTGGSSITGTVTLTGPAPSGGVVVTLGSSNPNVAAVPTNVTVPAGSSSTTFAVNTNFVFCPIQAMISGSANSVRMTVNLAVASSINASAAACRGPRNGRRFGPPPLR